MPYVFRKLFWLLPPLVHLLARCSEVTMCESLHDMEPSELRSRPHKKNEHQCIQTVLPYVTAETKLLMIAINDCREGTDGMYVCHRIEKCRHA
jgi:hypothetical protein